MATRSAGAEKTAIETALADLKSEVESDAENVEAINAKTQTLMQASMKLGEAMYQSSQAEAGAAQPEPAQDGVVDAEFEDVSDEHK